MLKKRLENKGAFLSIKNGFLANKPGLVFLCIKNVIMTVTGDIAYTKGNSYVSEKEGCITDNNGSVNHGTPIEFLMEYFKVKNYK